MKLLTLNTHSLLEENYEQKLDRFVEGILKERPDIIALQEVNQTQDAPIAGSHLTEGQFLLSAPVPVKEDNHAAQVVRRLRQAGLDCFWAWLPIKQGYEKYDEGIALLSPGRKITNVSAFPISRTADYHNWRRRAVLGIQTEGRRDWFYSVHTGWWDDGEDPFSEQWQRLLEQMEQPAEGSAVWLMGDFNAPDIFSDQSYALIRSHGWIDTHLAAKQKESDFTTFGIIDGWREKLPHIPTQGMRLDYIWCSQEREILSSRILFNGTNGPVVSDHFGLFIETKEGE